MNGQLHWNEDFDEPWRRLPWVVLGALACWIALLGGFARLLERHPAPAAPPPIEAQLVELPPPPTAGLQGGGHPVGAHHPPVIPVKPRHIARPKPHPVHHLYRRHVKPPPAIAKPPSPLGTAKTAPPAAPATASKESAAGTAAKHPAGAEAAGVAGGKGSGGGAGLGSDSSGARALYAPKPVIPDDLREGAFSTLAIARFQVSADGSVQVNLVKPTPIPRLNQILLTTLKQWRFFPAMRGGVAVKSEFEVRIPIAVQ